MERIRSLVSSVKESLLEIPVKVSRNTTVSKLC